MFVLLETQVRIIAVAGENIDALLSSLQRIFLLHCIPS
jgi:hypothetical protein